MISVVFDCNVVLAAIGWRGTPWRCLVLAARRQVAVYVTEEILAEYEAIIPKRLREEKLAIDWKPKLSWIRDVSHTVEPAPLGKQRSRDPDDDPYVACALAANATYVVTYDNDLLSLEKPFGIEVIRPAELVRRVK